MKEANAAVEAVLSEDQTGGGESVPILYLSVHLSKELR